MSAAKAKRGLAIERTALAWQRSSLTLAGASVVVGRLTYQAVGVYALLVVALGLGHAAVLFATAYRRYRIRLGVSTAKAWPTGVHAALIALQVVALSTLELVDVVT